jgi:hypothetical protein
MGLDITAYTKTTKVDCVFDADGEPIDPQTRQPLEDYARPCCNPAFTEVAEGLDSEQVFSYEDAFGFRAGSYGGYSNWRETLAKVAGYPALETERYGSKYMSHSTGAWEARVGPFAELINFSDCEGVIGPKTSAKLAKDFADFQEQADAQGDSDWQERYTSWRKAFEMAADSGFVSFH